MHGDRAQTQTAAGTLDAQCDFAAVGDQDGVEHLRHGSTHAKRSSGWPASTSCPEVTSTASTIASCSARTSLKTFMASITHSVWPALTARPAVTNGGSPGAVCRCTTPYSGARSSLAAAGGASWAPDVPLPRAGSFKRGRWGAVEGGAPLVPRTRRSVQPSWLNSISARSEDAIASMIALICRASIRLHLGSRVTSTRAYRSQQ